MTMFKDYYEILGISYPASGDQIKTAYREMSKKWHPDMNPGKDVTARMQDINEAYNILKDPVVKARYDREYVKFRASTMINIVSAENRYKYDIKDETLKEDVTAARKEAESYVKEFFSSFRAYSSAAVGGAWNETKGYLVLGVLLTVFISLFLVSVTADWDYSNDFEENITDVRELGSYDAPVFWNDYVIEDVFELSVPPTLELRQERDKYTQLLKKCDLYNNDVTAVFQQKGLSKNDKMAMNQYCRILITYNKGLYGDFLRSDETFVLDRSVEDMLDKMVYAESSGFDLIGIPRHQWVEINRANAIETSYLRDGVDGVVSCRIYLFFDRDKMMKICVSYRVNESNLWKEVLDNVIRTFRWHCRYV